MATLDDILIFQDYASFRKRQEVSLDKNINLLFGPNNAGKTSFLKLLLYINNLSDSNFHDINPINIKVDDKLVHIGNLKEKVNRKSKSGYLQVGGTISPSFTSYLKLTDAMKRTLHIKQEHTHYKCLGYIEWSLGLYGHEIREIKFTVSDMKLLVGKEKTSQIGKGITISLQDSETVELMKFDSDCKCVIRSKKGVNKYSTYYFKVIDYDFFLFFSLLKGNNNWIFDQKDFLTETLFQDIIDSANDFMLNREDISIFIRGNDMFIKNYNLPINEYVDDTKGKEMPFTIPFKEPNIDLDLNVLSILGGNFAKNFEMINYIPPLRDIPDGFITERDKNLDYASLFLKNSRVKNNSPFANASKLEKRESTELIDEIDFINAVLIELKFDHIFKIITVNDPDKSFEQDFLVLENIHTRKISKINELGTGLSQILPIIIKLFKPDLNYVDKPAYLVGFESSPTLTLVEQPEVHLHPGLQAKFGKICTLYLKYSNTGKVFLETHSEHIIKSIQLEVAKHHASNGKDGISHEDVSILYFSSENGESNIREITLDETGSFTEPWPDDFFEISGDLTLERLLSGAKSRN